LPKITAHRGIWGLHHENTLEAVALALAEGVDYVEIDVRLTSDGQVVVIHDETLARIWGLDRRVDELTWNLVSGLRVDSPAGVEQRIPLLSEVLDLFDGRGADTPTLLIDMDHLAVALPAWNIAGKSRADVAWCGYLPAMQAIRDADPEAEIWMPWNHPGLPLTADLEVLKPTYINSNHLVLSKADIAVLHARGQQVSVWTVDEAAAQRWAIDAGVDAITTNRVSVLKAELADTQENDLQDYALATARELGRFAIEYTRTAGLGQVSLKAHAADLVTEVDTAIEAFVRRVIVERFPDHGFVGEEYGAHSESAAYCWYLDPVDGTTNLANGMPWTSFSLALAVNGQPKVAVVVDPWRGDLFEASAGGGARLNGMQLMLPDLEPLVPGSVLSGRVVSTELAGHVAWPGFQQFFDSLVDQHCTLRIMGSGTLTLTGIAAGRGCGSVIHQFNPIDHLAGVLIAHEAGALVLDSAGNRNLFPASGGVLVAHPAAAQEVFEAWSAAVASVI